MPQSAVQLANLNRNGRKRGSRNKPRPVEDRVKRATRELLDRAVGRPPAAPEDLSFDREKSFRETRRILGLDE